MSSTEDNNDIVLDANVAVVSSGAGEKPKKKKPRDPSMRHSALAVTLYGEGDLLGAMREFHSALDIQLKALAAADSIVSDQVLLKVAATHFNLGMVLSDQGDWLGARREYDNALEIRQKMVPNSLKEAECHSALGYVLHREGSLDQSRQLYKKALEIRELQAPNTVATTCHQLGLVLRDQGALEEALAQLTRALNLEEAKASVSDNVASLYKARGSVRKKQDDLDGALEDHSVALMVCKRVSTDSMEAASVHCEIGDILYEQGKLEEALEEYSIGLQMQEFQAPGSVEVAYTSGCIGQVLLEQRDFDEALRQFRRACDIYDRKSTGSSDLLAVANSHHGFGRVLHVKGEKLDAVLAEYRKALAIREMQAPNSLDEAESHKCIGAVLYERGEVEGALVEYQQELEIRKGVADSDSLELARAYRDVGFLSHCQGETDCTLDTYRKALEIREREVPDSMLLASSYSDLGSALYACGDLDASLDMLISALALQQAKAPESLAVAKSHTDIGLVRIEQQDRVAAIVAFTKASAIANQSRLELPDKHALKIASAYYLGAASLHKCLYKKALVQAEKLLGILPEYKWAHVLKARSLVGLGDYETAMASFDEAASMSPNYGDAFLGRVEVALALAEAPIQSDEERKKRLRTVRKALKAAWEVDPERDDYVDHSMEQTIRRASCRQREKAEDAWFAQNLYIPEAENSTREDLRRELSDLQARLESYEETKGKHQVDSANQGNLTNAESGEVSQRTKWTSGQATATVDPPLSGPTQNLVIVEVPL